MRLGSDVKSPSDSTQVDAAKSLSAANSEIDVLRQTIVAIRNQFELSRVGEQERIQRADHDDTVQMLQATTRAEVKQLHLLVQEFRDRLEKPHAND